jgi:fluoride ion exporter CrcB/FEX
MGLLQPSTVLELAVPMALAWLPAFHSLQRAAVLHTALRTGLCGSLTTYSSWNSEMVVLMLGSNNNDDRSRLSQLFRGLLGYIVGMETSLGSYECGCSLAKRLHQYINPVLAAEMVAARSLQAQGVHINQDLPDLERRFLTNLQLNHMQSHRDLYHPERMDALAEWRDATVNARRIGHHLLPILIRVENAILIERTILDTAVENIVSKNGWPLEKLLQYAEAKRGDLDALPHVSSSFSQFHRRDVADTRDLWWCKLPIAATILATMLAPLFMGLMFIYGDDPANITYRTMIYSMILAPTGALLRWYLSTWNNARSADFLPAQWTWLPSGTFTANMLGSVVSILMVSLEYKLVRHYESSSSSSSFSASATIPFWQLGTIRAIKIGFSGCLTTVSTFAAEVRAFMHTKTDHAYPYIFATLTTSFILASIVYGIVLAV